jgi:hypothetical protein
MPEPFGSLSGIFIIVKSQPGYDEQAILFEPSFHIASVDDVTPFDMAAGKPGFSR